MKCHVETPLLATIFMFHVSNVQVGGQKHCNTKLPVEKVSNYRNVSRFLTTFYSFS